jgi:hypothetical protein
MMKFLTGRSGNYQLPISRHFYNLFLQSGFFSILSDIVVSSPNFKVRLSAAVALAAPATRKHYFTFYLVAWKALLEALSSADNIQDFKEFQHRDNLITQVNQTPPKKLQGAYEKVLIQSI